jgi:hypothetical protein
MTFLTLFTGFGFFPGVIVPFQTWGKAGSAGVVPLMRHPCPLCSLGRE